MLIWLAVLLILINDGASFSVGKSVVGKIVFPTWTSPPTTQLWSSVREEMNWDPKAAPKLDFNEDFYAVLECANAAADGALLKRLYYKMVFEYHPDSVKDSTDETAKALCNKQMMVINNAYRVLKDGDLRKVYDGVRGKGGRFGNAALQQQQQGSTSSTEAKAGASSAQSVNSKKSAPNTSEGDDDDVDWERLAWQNMERDRREGSGFGGFGGFGSEKGSDRARSDADTGARGQGQRRSAPFGWDFDQDGNAQPQRQRQRADGTWEVEPNTGDDARRNYEKALRDAQERAMAQAMFAQQERERERRSAAAAAERDYSRYKDLDDFLTQQQPRGAEQSQDDPRAASLRAAVSRLSAQYQRQKLEVEQDRRDWGEVTNPILIQRRVEALNAVRRIEEQLAEAEDELVDYLERQKEKSRRSPPPPPRSSSSSSSASGRAGGSSRGGESYLNRGAGAGSAGTWRQQYQNQRSGRPEEFDADEDDGDSGSDGRPGRGGGFLDDLEDLLRSGRKPPPPSRRR